MSINGTQVLRTFVSTMPVSCFLKQQQRKHAFWHVLVPSSCVRLALSLLVSSRWCLQVRKLTCADPYCCCFFADRCVGVWQNDRVEIIANDQGNRTTPSYVAFTDTERLIGDAAKNQVAMNPRNTVFDAK